MLVSESEDETAAYFSLTGWCRLTYGHPLNLLLELEGGATIERWFTEPAP